MFDDSLLLEKTLAFARRRYWRTVYESALVARDQATAATALRFMKEYGAERPAELAIGHQGWTNPQ